MVMFSLIVGTLARTREVAQLLASLESQTCQDFELILVDQNIDDRLVPIIAASNLTIQHIRTTQLGLSRARNIGLAVASGSIVVFPDDDCWYPDNLLVDVDHWFATHPEQDGVSGQSRDEHGHLSQIPWPARPAVLNPHNVWRRAISISVFLRRRVVSRVGAFDETLGVGAGTPWGSGEETDYLLRAMAANFHLAYDPSIIVFHPEPLAIYDQKLLARGMTYGAGMGRVLRKHGAPYWFMVYILFRALAGVSISLVRFESGQALFHWNVFKGRLLGLLSSIPHGNIAQR